MKRHYGKRFIHSLAFGTTMRILQMADIEYYIGAVCLIVGSIRESLTCLGRRWSGNYVDTRTISGICRCR